jgi:hypothetical protein
MRALIVATARLCFLRSLTSMISSRTIAKLGWHDLRGFRVKRLGIELKKTLEAKDSNVLACGVAWR